MSDEERASSDRRLQLTLLAAGVAVMLIVVGLLAVGRSLRAPSSAFDADGTAQALSEGLDQVATTAQASAAKVSATGGKA